MKSPRTRANIRRLYEVHGCHREVARVLDIPTTTVHRIVTTPDKLDKLKRGPLKVITNRDTTKIKRLVRNSNEIGEQCTSRKVQSECDLNHVSRRTIQRHLKTIRFEYKSAVNIIKLSKIHKERRVSLIKEWTRDNVDWTKVIFSDEKRFCLDGPDSWSTYTDENRNIYRNKRQNKGGGIMVWGMITFCGYFHLIRMEGNYNSGAYCALIIDNIKDLLAEMSESGGPNIFQQDNCKIHVSKTTIEHLRINTINTMQWPARSPDLNPIENVWSWMVNFIYKDKAQYNTKEDLWTAIEAAVDNINQERGEDLKNLYRSMPTRLLKVIEKRGETIPY